MTDISARSIGSYAFGLLSFPASFSVSRVPPTFQCRLSFQALAVMQQPLRGMDLSYHTIPEAPNSNKGTEHLHLTQPRSSRHPPPPTQAHRHTDTQTGQYIVIRFENTTRTMAAPPPDVAERIRSKKAQYTRLADTKQWDKFDAIFVPDATFTFVDADGKVIVTPDEAATPYQWHSLESWAAFFEKALADAEVIHLAGPGEFELVGPDEVKAVFTVVYHCGAKRDDGTAAPHETAGGHYYETWVRRGGDWYCKDLWMQRLYHRVT
ncbi:hypothetical protein VTK56DRAFT_3101 [Thermocarpiscus australiensis]